eukprot:14631731-Alexandrium_andersonii.AAC.1
MGTAAAQAPTRTGRRRATRTASATRRGPRTRRAPTARPRRRMGGSDGKAGRSDWFREHYR